MPVDQSIYRSDEGGSCFNKLSATIGSLIYVLLTLLQLKYENKDTSPFETHGLVMMLFIVKMLTNTSVAVSAIIVQALFTKHSLVQVLNLIFIAFGVLACDLRLLILAPPFGYFVLVIWVLLLLLVLLYYVFIALALHHLLGYRAAYRVQNFFQKCMVHRPLLQETSRASTAPASPMELEGSEMNVVLTVP